MYQLTTSERLTRTMIAAIVTAIEMAQKRVPSEYSDFTFFARSDTWIYHAVFDVDICALCQAAAVPFTYSGLHLRREFPYLEISSVNNIFPRVHPNCRCWLERSGVDYHPIVQVDDEVDNPKVARQLATRLLRELPDKHTEDLSAFRVYQEIPFYWDAAGAYHRQAKAIAINQAILSNEEYARGIIYHEVGHHVFRDDMSRQETDEWNAIWFDAVYVKVAPYTRVKRDQHRMPTDYATESDSEGYAECYWFYFLGGEQRDKLDPEIRDYFDRQFKG